MNAIEFIENIDLQNDGSFDLGGDLPQKIDNNTPPPPVPPPVNKVVDNDEPDVKPTDAPLDADVGTNDDDLWASDATVEIDKSAKEGNADVLGSTLDSSVVYEQLGKELGFDAVKSKDDFVGHAKMLQVKVADLERQVAASAKEKENIFANFGLNSKERSDYAIAEQNIAALSKKGEGYITDDYLLRTFYRDMIELGKFGNSRDFFKNDAFDEDTFEQFLSDEFGFGTSDINGQYARKVREANEIRAIYKKDEEDRLKELRDKANNAVALYRQTVDSAVGSLKSVVGDYLPVSDAGRNMVRDILNSKIVRVEIPEGLARLLSANGKENANALAQNVALLLAAKNPKFVSALESKIGTKAAKKFVETSNNTRGIVPPNNSIGSNGGGSKVKGAVINKIEIL